MGPSRLRFSDPAEVADSARLEIRHPHLLAQLPEHWRIWRFEPTPMNHGPFHRSNCCQIKSSNGLGLGHFIYGSVVTPITAPRVSFSNRKAKATEICWYHLRTMQEEGRHGPAQHQYSPSEFSTNLSFNEFLRELTYHIRVSNI